MYPTIAATTTRNDSVSVTLSYLNNGSIFELDQVRFKQNLTYQQSLDIVSHLSCENSKNFDLQQFNCELKKSKETNKNMSFFKTYLSACLRLRKMWKMHRLTNVFSFTKLIRKKKL